MADQQEQPKTTSAEVVEAPVQAAEEAAALNDSKVEGREGTMPTDTSQLMNEYTTDLNSSSIVQPAATTDASKADEETKKAEKSEATKPVDESNYQTNRPVESAAQEEQPIAGEQEPTTEVNKPLATQETLNQISSDPPNLGLPGHQNSNSLAVSDAGRMDSQKVGEDTPAFDNDAPASMPRSDTEQQLQNIEKLAINNLNQEKQLAGEMRKIPETNEPEETQRDYNSASAMAGHKNNGENDIVKEDLQTAAGAQDDSDVHYRTAAGKQASAILDDQEAHLVIQPQIEIDNSSMEGIDEVEPISIDKELFQRLLKVKVISDQECSQSLMEVEASTEKKWALTKYLTVMYQNGRLFSRYLIFLKKHMKHEYNQIWSFKVASFREMSDGNTEEIRKANWDIVNGELDKISITINEASLAGLVKAEQAHSDKIFTRIERYSKMITHAGFLKFEAITEEDKYNDGMDDSTVYNQNMTVDDSISELISLRQNTVRSNRSKAMLTKMITRGETKVGSKQFIMPPGINAPEKSQTMLENALNVRGMDSELLNNSREESPNPNNRGYIKVDKDFTMIDSKTVSNGGDRQVSPKPTENLQTELDVRTSHDIKQLSNNALSEVKPDVKPYGPPKQVKDGVDILALDPSKDTSECDSSLELILVTLSKAFGMSPKQAAALLTNNNQYLITACIKGVKGGKYEPLLNWYDQLNSNCVTLATLLTCEMDQLPQSSKQTFVKVMAAIACGFYSYNVELVYMTFSLFTQLFQHFQSDGESFSMKPAASEQSLEQALKWFLSHSPSKDTQGAEEETTVEQLLNDKPVNGSHAAQQTELINAGGLRLSLYAISKHREATRQAMQLYSVLCQVPDQMFMIYGQEMQSHTKSILEYMELIGDFLPLLSEQWPEQAIESGLVDFWLDLCSREAESDVKIQSREKVLAISLLAEIWILFTDYVDDREEVTNTLIYVFKRTVSERTKSIRLISIAYLFKVLETLITSKKKAALTLYRSLIYSLVETPLDPTVRELFLCNFSDLFKLNPKMPVEWLLEPFLKQIKSQLGVTFVLKVFDFTFMLNMMDHPKFKSEQACKMFELFSQVSLDDTSYATSAHQIMCGTLQRFLTEVDPSESTRELLDKTQEHIRLNFDLLLDLEPISRQAAQTQIKRQQRQHALKFRHGMSIGGRSSNLSSIIQTPGSVGGKPPLKARDLLGAKNTTSMVSLGSQSKSNYQKEMQRKHKKSLIICLLLKIQSLGLSVINDGFLRELLFEKMVEFKSVYGYFNKGHLELLKAYGDQETLIVENNLDPQLVEQQRLEREIAQENNYGQYGQQRGTSNKVSPYNKLQGSIKMRNSTPGQQISSRDKSEERTNQSREGIVALVDKQASEVDGNSRQIVPFNEGGSQSNARAKSIGSRARALQEIEKIKQKKLDRVQKKEQEQENLRLASAKRKRRLKAEISKRKQKLGIADKVQSRLFAGTTREESQDGIRPSRFETKQVSYINIDEEEERDRETVLEFMRKYQKLWRNIFAKYQNTGHKANALTNPTFTKKSLSLNFAEITKLLKDHGTYPQLLNKEELSNMVRLVNQKKNEADKSDIQSLNFAGYQSFLIQLAVHCFSRPPQDLSTQPIVASLQALVNTFEEATKKRNLSTLLYEDPDAVIAQTPKEKEMCRQLNETVKTQPDYPMPDGFLKVKEKVPVYNYKVPDSAKQYLGEAKTVCVEIVDELLSKLFDFHVLEPLVTMQEQYRVKPSMQRSLQKINDKKSNRAEALSIIRRAEERKAQEPGNPVGSRSTNRSNLPKIGSVNKKQKLTMDDLPPVYKKVVAQQPKDKKAIYEDVSFILEGVVRKALGEPELKPPQPVDELPQSSDAMSQDSKRLSLPGSSQKNLVKLLPPLEQEDPGDRIKFEDVRKRKDREQNRDRLQKERRRQERQRKLKDDLVKLKEEREAKLEEDKLKAAEEAKKKKESDKVAAEKRKKLREDAKMEITTKKEENETYDAEAAAAEAEEARALELQKAKEKREFFRKQQEKLANQFASMSEQRKAQSLQEQQKAQKEKQKKQVLKNIIDQQAKAGQGQGERQLAADLVTFMQRPEVKQIFADHDKSLQKYFKYYCKQGRVELGQQDINFRLENLDYTCFNKLGLQSKIVPVLVSSEQLKSTFRNTVKQYQLTSNADLAVVTSRQNASNEDLGAAVNGSKTSDGPGNGTQRNPSTLGEATSSQYIDFESFKKALVRIAVQGQELLGGQSEEQKQRKAEQDEKRRQTELRKKELMKNRYEQKARLESETMVELRSEFAQKQKQIQSVTSRSPVKNISKVQSEGELIGAAASGGDNSTANKAINEEDFQRWLKQQDNIGNGLNQRVAEKMSKASRPAVIKTQPAATTEAPAASDSANGVQDTPSKSVVNLADEANAEEANSGAPLQRAKQQSQALRGSALEGADQPAPELDIAFISGDTVKALFEFMKIEAGEEGEKTIDQVLAAQSSYQGRGRGVNQLKQRALSKEPAALQAQSQEQ